MSAHRLKHYKESFIQTSRIKRWCSINTHCKFVHGKYGYFQSSFCTVLLLASDLVFVRPAVTLFCWNKLFTSRGTVSYSQHYSASKVLDAVTGELNHLYILTSFISIQPWRPGLAGTRAHSCGSGTLHPGQVLGGSLPSLSPAFRRSHFCRQMRREIS